MTGGTVSLEDVVCFVQLEVARNNGRRLAGLRTGETKNILEAGGKHEPWTHAVLQAAASSQGDAPVLQQVIAALNQANAVTDPKGSQATKDKRKVNARSFKGCWHCGKPDHTRGPKCAAYMKILNANGGKRPSDYEGAYERWRKANGLKVNCIMEQPDAGAPAAPAEMAAAIVADTCSQCSTDSEEELIMRGEWCFNVQCRDPGCAHDGSEGLS